MNSVNLFRNPQTIKHVKLIHHLGRSCRIFLSPSTGLNHKHPMSSKNNGENGEKKLDLAKPKDRKKWKDDMKEKLKTVEGVSSDLVQSVKSVADSIGGDKEKTESDLLGQLRAHSQKVDESKKEFLQPSTKTKIDLSSLVAGMAVEKSESPEQTSVKNDRQRFIRDIAGEDRNIIKLFDGPRLNIFDDEFIQNKSQIEESKNKIFDQVEQKELDRLIDTPPTNAFEEMIQWTKHGKMWKFPIDNAQDFHEELKVPFTDHVFLDKHINDWVPNKGPLRHFMELVCVGLSKNPWILVNEKIEHINWFKEYFKDKAHMLEFNEKKDLDDKLL